MYILRSIIALVVVIWLVNVLLKYLSQYTNKQTTTIEIIERVSVSKSSSLALVKIVNQYYLMSISENTSEILREFTEEEHLEIEEQLKEKAANEPLALSKTFEIKKLKEKYANFFDQSK